MSLSDSLLGWLVVIHSHHPLSPGQLCRSDVTSLTASAALPSQEGLPSSCPNFLHELSATTPAEPSIASIEFFTDGRRLQRLPASLPLQISLLTRLYRFTVPHYGSCICPSRLRPQGFPRERPTSYMYHSTTYMTDSFHSVSLAKLAWRTAKAGASTYSVVFANFVSMFTMCTNMSRPFSY